jgi:hypothetical protein
MNSVLPVLPNILGLCLRVMCRPAVANRTRERFALRIRTYSPPFFHFARRFSEPSM